MISRILFRIFNFFLDYIKANFVAVITFAFVFSCLAIFGEMLLLLHLSSNDTFQIFGNVIHSLTGLPTDVSGVYTGDQFMPHLTKVLGIIGFIFFIILEMVRFFGFAPKQATLKGGVRAISIAMASLFFLNVALQFILSGSIKSPAFFLLFWVLAVGTYALWYAVYKFQKWFVDSYKEAHPGV